MKHPHPEAAQTFPRSSLPRQVLLVLGQAEASTFPGTWLQGLPLVLTPVRTIAEALDHIHSSLTDLVVFGWPKPDQDLAELVRLLRRQPCCGDLPVLFVLPPGPTPKERTQVRALGAVEVLSGPRDPETLRSLIQAKLDHVPANSAWLRMLDQLPLIHWTTDESLRITSLGGKGLEALGIRPGRGLGNRLPEALGAEDPAIPAHERTLEGRPTTFQRSYRSLVFECYLEPVLDEWGKVQGVAGIALEGTAERRLVRIEVAQRKGTQESLRELARRERERARDHEALMRSVPGAIWIGSDEGRSIVGNPYSYEILGMANGQNVSKSAPEGAMPAPYRVTEAGRPVAPDDLPLHRVSRSGVPELGRELEIHRADGSTRVIFGNTVPIVDDLGRVKRAVAAFSDITGRKEAERSLERLAEERSREIEDLHRLHEYSSRISGALEVDKICAQLLEATTGIQNMSMGFLELLDPERKELYVARAVGHRPETAQRVGFIPVAVGQGACGTAGATRERVIIEDVETDPLFASYRGFARWAGFRAVWSVPLLGRGGDLVGVLSTHHPQPRRPSNREIRLVELYARHAAAAIENARLFEQLERELDQRKNSEGAKFRLAAIVESSDDAIVSKTLDGTVTSWNQGAERLLGYRSVDILGKSIMLLIPEERRLEEQEILSRIARGERLDQFETVRRRKDGRLIDVSLSISPVRDDQGTIIGASKIARDISDQIQARKEAARINAVLEERVLERTLSLRETVRELDSFAYTVAHDLRAPLRAIHMFGQMLLEDSAPKPEVSEAGYLGEIIQAASRMDALIDDLLTYSRLSRKETPLASLDLEEVVDQVLKESQGEIQRRHAEVLVARPLHRVAGHTALLAQALTNLLSNAIKFVGPEKIPRVTVRTVRLAPAEGRTGGLIRIWVEDNGIGIASQHCDKLFRVFERLHSREAYPGTGIGLAIVRRAAERMGGQAGVDSVAGEGSRFWIDLGEGDERGIPGTSVERGQA